MRLFLTKISTLFLLLSSTLLASPLFADDQAQIKEENALSSTPLTKKYNLSVCAIFKNEAAYIKEWLEYNMLIGVEHFYLYNNGSTDDSLIVLDPYIKAGIVTLIDWPDRNDPSIPEDAPYKWVVYTQLPAYDHACRVSAIAETKWLALIDVDEYILPMQTQTFTEILAKCDAFPGVALIWHTYGTSGVAQIPEKTLLIETLHMACHPDHAFSNKIVKSIVKPELFEGFSWPPHTCNYKDHQIYFIFSKDEARINHYINRTTEYVSQIKIKNKEHMENRVLSQPEINELLSLGNDVEDTDLVIHRFVPALRKRMGYDPIQ
jgi:hypothetical protein